MPSNFSIYIIRNSVNGKMYVGQTTTSLRVRWSAHFADAKAGSRMPISLALLKYGRGSFEIWKIAEGQTQEELNALEIFFINFFNTRNEVFGYNLLPGGRGAGEKISHALKSLPSKLRGVKKSPLHVLNNSLAQKRYWSTIPKELRSTHSWSRESREKMRAIHLGTKNPHPLESRKNYSEAAKQGWIKRKLRMENRKDASISI